MCILMIICCTLILQVNGIPAMTLDNTNNNNIFLLWSQDRRTLNKLHSNSFEDLASMSPTDIQRRNVIMPRICYFSRVTKAGVHQKLCLPYNDVSRS
jgi:hypothetical protein